MTYLLIKVTVEEARFTMLQINYELIMIMKSLITEYLILNIKYN